MTKQEELLERIRELKVGLEEQAGEAKQLLQTVKDLEEEGSVK